MRSTSPLTFPIDLTDLETVIELLSDQVLLAVNDLETRDLIISDLAKLPSSDIWPFTATFINSFKSRNADHGGGSQWVSIDADEYSLRFSVGNHDRTPGIGGDTFSETVFECWPGGRTEGRLSDWLSQLNLLDRDLIKISISHERARYDNRTEPIIVQDEWTHGTPPSLSNAIVLETRRERLIFALKKAADDPRLSSELQQRAKMHLGRLLAISRRRPNV
jgi:hypothetical protein